MNKKFQMLGDMIWHSGKNSQHPQFSLDIPPNKLAALYNDVNIENICETNQLGLACYCLDFIVLAKIYAGS